MLFRSALCILNYHDVRPFSKFESAAAEAASLSLQEFRDIPLSHSIATRALTELQPRGEGEVFTFSRMEEAKKQSVLEHIRTILEMFREDFAKLNLPFPEFLWSKSLVAIEIGSGPRPEYSQQ
jgi:hypothetical protein